MPTAIKILIYLLMIIAVSSCMEAQQNRPEDQGLTNDDCDDSPGGKIECCFINMPETLQSTMIIPTSGETADELIISGTVYKADAKTPYPDIILYAYHIDSKGYYSKNGNETGIQKWHGKLHGWCKTDSAGRYTIKTIRPAPYPGNLFPAHIHASIKTPDGFYFHINDYVFNDDPLVNKKYESALPYDIGGTGIIELEKVDSIWIGKRDVVLGD